MKLGQIVGRIAGFVWSVFRILWVCRVSALSALGGGLLIVLVEQARDLFADTGLSRNEWLCFFVMLFVWAWLVHSMARRALQFDEWVPQAHRPGGLSNADRAELQKQYWFVATWIPRLLGLIVFIATAGALWLTRANLLHATDLEQVRLAIALNRNLQIATAVVAVAYLVLVFFRRSLLARMTRLGKDAPLLIGAQSVLVLGFRAAINPSKNWPALRAIFNSWPNRLLISAAFVVTGIFLVAIIWPDVVSDKLPRVMFLPLLLGGAILLLGEIGSLSYRYATPLLLCFFVVGGILGYFLKHYNDVRWVAPVSTPGPANGTSHQLGIQEAIKRWKADNCRSANDCRRPIVIAGAGGASRAGFYTASVVGAIIDAGMGDPELGDIRSRIFALSTVSGSSVGAVMMRAAWMDALENNDLSKPPCRKTTTTAWFRSADQQHTSGDPTASWRDCFQLLMAGDFLSPIFVGFTYRDLFPLGNLRTGIALGEDRSGLLEQSFERWYHSITRGKSHACVDGDNSGLCRRLGHLPDRSEPLQPDQWIPLLFVNGTSVASGRRIIVSDVRIGCIVGDPNNPDRRFLEFAYDYREMRDKSVRHLADDICDRSLPDKGMEIDMRLSTVAMMSARFPLVSTQGVIRDLKGRIVDSVVDGGYFENEGLATAADIVAELQKSELQPVVIRVVNEPDEKIDRHEPGNTPKEQKEYKDYKRRILTDKIARDGEVQLIRQPLPKPGNRELFDVYTSIGRALYATRSGHEEGHLAYLRETLKGPLVRIGVNSVDVPASPPLSPQASTRFCRSPVQKNTTMDVVSMSWWMSQSVQVYLDAQFCQPQINRLMCVLKLKKNEGYQKCDNIEPGR
jgi:hypothetical protein